MLVIITNPFEDLIVVEPVRLAACDVVERAGVVDLCATRERMAARISLSKAALLSWATSVDDVLISEDE